MLPPGARPHGFALAGALACGLACGGAGPGDCAAPRGGAAAEWPAYGNDPGGTRYAALADLTPANVRCLEPAWTHHTGDLPGSRGEHSSQLAAEVTPILADGSLFLCTPYDRVIALDPETGAERWAFDPELDLSGHYANQLVCRGVSTWLDAEAAPGEELWKGRLPTAGFATPMTYRARAGGRQYVVIAAMGYGRAGVPVRDALVAFALPPPR